MQRILISNGPKFRLAPLLSLPVANSSPFPFVSIGADCANPRRTVVLPSASVKPCCGMRDECFFRSSNRASENACAASSSISADVVANAFSIAFCAAAAGIRARVGFVDRPQSAFSSWGYRGLLRWVSFSGSPGLPLFSATTHPLFSATTHPSVRRPNSRGAPHFPLG